ncbi:Fatty acid cis/trans isomerase (CTI) [compost metagenome]
MDQIRMEAEELFLAFLPPEQRLDYRRDWYKGFLTRAKIEYVFPPVGVAAPTGIRFNSETKTKSQLVTKILFFRMNEAVRGPLDSLNWKNMEIPDSVQERLSINPTEKVLRTIASVQAGKKTPFARHFSPDLALLIIDSADPSQKIYSVIHNKEHENISWILGESLRMLPAQDSLTIREGIWGSYPNMIFRVKEAALGAFVKKLGAMKSPEDYRKLVQVYGVSRTDPHFWSAYDDVQKLFSQGPASEYGYLDLTRYALE